MPFFELDSSFYSSQHDGGDGLFYAAGLAATVDADVTVASLSYELSLSLFAESILMSDRFVLVISTDESTDSGMDPLAYAYVMPEELHNESVDRFRAVRQLAHFPMPIAPGIMPLFAVTGRLVGYAAPILLTGGIAERVVEASKAYFQKHQDEYHHYPLIEQQSLFDALTRRTSTLSGWRIVEDGQILAIRNTKYVRDTLDQYGYTRSHQAYFQDWELVDGCPYIYLQLDASLVTE